MLGGPRQADAEADVIHEDPSVARGGLAEAPPAFTVAICTRDRGAALLATIDAILRGSFQDIEIVVIDQSDDEATRIAIQGIHCGSRLRYIKTASRGLSAARNEALLANRSRWIAFTDDDCEPAEDWLSQLAEAAKEVNEPAILFGRLSPNPDLAERGMVPSWSAKDGGRHNDTWREYCLGGFGGNMAMNIEAIALNGPFNTRLGRGGELSACEEGEFALRLCLRGGAVWELHRPEVLHHGVVAWPDVRASLKADFGSTGHVLGWYLRNGQFSAIVQFLYCIHQESRLLTLNLIRRRRPLGLRRPIWLLRGFLNGIRDRKPIPYLTQESVNDALKSH